MLGRKFGHELAVAAADLMIQSDLFQIVESRDSYGAALDTYRRLPGSVSFTDCIVMAIAEQYGTRLIFGFDEIFARCGYALPALSHAAAG